jgi:hypothetical protein
MNPAPGKVDTDLFTGKNLAQTEDEFQRFEKWGRDHDDLDEEVEKDAQEWDCQKNHLVFQ